MEFDEREWVLLAESGEDARSDSEWVVTDAAADDRPLPRSVSGVFLLAFFAPFDPRAAAALPDSLPPSARPCCSAGGLLLLRGPWSSYYVVNPVTAQWAALPRPPRAVGRHPALALVPDPPHYFVVSALPISPGLYSFDIFSSADGQWRSSAADARVGDCVVASSGVSAAGAAYWRTTDDLILFFDPKSDAARMVPPPPALGAVWQIGEAGGRLCCARLAGSTVEVLAVGPGGAWAILGSFRLVESVEVDGWDGGEAVGWCQESPSLLRFEGTDPEAILLFSSKLVGVNVVTGRVRELELSRTDPSVLEDCVAHINTLAEVWPGV